MPHVFDHCNTEELAEAFGRLLTSEELHLLSSEIQNTARVRLARELDSTMDDALRNAVPDAIITMQSKLADKKRQAALNLAVVVNAVKNIKKDWSGDFSAEGLKAVMIGSPFRKPGAKLSAFGDQQMAMDRNIGGFNRDLSLQDPDGKLRSRFVKGGEFDDEIRRAGHAIDDVDGAADTLGDLDPDAIALAKTMMRHVEMSRQSINRVGGSIPRLPGRVVKQTHDVTKVTHARKALSRAGVSFSGETDRDAWVSYMIENLDFDRSFSQLADEPLDGDAIALSLGKSYDSLSRGEHLQSVVGEGSGKVGFGLEQERIFFFKDGLDGEINYNKIFGNDSLREDFLNEMVLKGKKEGLMRVLGPNAFQNLREITLSVQKMARDNPVSEKRFNKITGGGRFLNPENITSTPMSRWWSEIAGHTAHPVENLLATSGAAIRTLQNLSKLGRATLASIVDVALAGSSFRYQGRSFFDSYADAFETIFESKRSSEYKREVWEALNIGTTVMNNMGVSRGISDDTPIGLFGRLNNFYFKFNLLSPWTDNMKRGVALSNARYLGIQAQKPWGSLRTEFKEMMGAYGIDEADWNLFSKIDYGNSPDGKAYLSIDSINELPDSAFPKGVNILEAREQLERKLRIYFNDQADASVVTPDAETRALTTFGQPGGTYIGEFARFFFQFKTFPVAIYKRVIRREVFGRGTQEQNFFKALTSGNGEFQAMGELLMSSTLMGYAALTLKDLSAGKTPRRPETASQHFHLMLDSMLQGGSLGIYGDILIGDIARENPASRGILETFGGPTFSFVKDDILGNASVLTYGMMSGDDGEKIATRMWRSIQNNTPFANTFWLKMSLDTMFMNNIGEDLSPGYSDRLKKAAKERGQEYFIPLP